MGGDTKVSDSIGGFSHKYSKNGKKNKENQIWGEVGTRASQLKVNLMSTHSLDHQYNSLGVAISLSSKPIKHGWVCICNYKPINLNHNH